MMISTNPARRHLLVAMMRICALLVFLICSPLLYFISTSVVASSLVTISFTVALIGSCNKPTIRPSPPFDPSPPLVMHIINVTTFPPQYSTNCITFIARPPRPRPQNSPPDPILFALSTMHYPSQSGDNYFTPPHTQIHAPSPHSTLPRPPHHDTLPTPHSRRPRFDCGTTYWHLLQLPHPLHPTPPPSHI